MNKYCFIKNKDRMLRGGSKIEHSNLIITFSLNIFQNYFILHLNKIVMYFPKNIF